MDQLRTNTSHARPSILNVVEPYTDLHKARGEYRGLCPLHREQTPSFYVDADKGVFHCFGCGVGGDVIRFVELIEGVDFKGALAILGLSDQCKPTTEQTERRARRRAAADEIARWSRNLSERIGDLLRLNFQQRGIMRECNLELHRELLCEFATLSAWQDSLCDADDVLGMWRMHDVITAILVDPIDHTGPSPEVAAWAAEVCPLKDRIPQWLHKAADAPEGDFDDV